LSRLRHPGYVIATLASPTCALANVEAAPLSRPSPTREASSSSSLHGGGTEEIGPTLWKAPAFGYAGAIGKRNQASERWLPHVSQQGRSSITPDAPLWLRGNDSTEWKRLREAGLSRSLVVGSERFGGSLDRRQKHSRTLRRWLAHFGKVATLRGWHPNAPSLSQLRAGAS
jgi:hypothetical protein